MPLPASLTELCAVLAEFRLVSEGVFEMAVPPRTVAPNDVSGALQRLSNFPAPWADGVCPGEMALSPFEIECLTHGSPDDLRCDSWRLRSKIGEGGMGTVFAARNVETDRIDAIKFFKQCGDAPLDAVNRERFDRECRALAQLSHPGLPHLYFVGRRNGVPYFVMEHVRGRTIEEVAAAPVALPVALRWFLDLSEIVRYVHQKGYLHRDIKPSNILVATDGRIVLLDLGLCLNERVRQITRAIIGTAETLSPEAWEDSHDVTAESDIYSLGCTFFRVLTGRMPFQGTVVQLQHLHRNERPDRVSQIRPDCPAWLDDLVNSMLEKRADNRPHTLQEVRVCLERGLRGSQSGQERHHRLSGDPPDRARFELDQSLVRYVRDTWANVAHLNRVDSANFNGADRAMISRGLESGIARWSAAMKLAGMPSPAQLPALGELLKEIEQAMGRNWPPDVSGAVIDSLSRHYTSVLVYLADSLIEDRLAQAGEVRMDLVPLRQEVEYRLGAWKEALTRPQSRSTAFDEKLRKSIHGPYHKNLAAVLDQFDRRLGEQFDEAIRHQLRTVASDDEGHLIREFLLDEAIPYWRSRAALLRLDALSLYVGSCLTAFLELIRPDAHRVLDCVPKIAKALQLDGESPDADAIRAGWPAALRTQLDRDRARLAEAARAHDDFARRLYESLEVLRPAIDGRRRAVQRIVLSDESPGPLHGFLVHRDNPAESLPCSILDLRRDLMGVRVSVPNAGATARQDLLRAALSGFSADRAESDSNPVLPDFTLEVRLPDGTAMRFKDLECAWWTAGNPMRIGASVSVLEGNLVGFVQHVLSVYALRVSPQERFF